MGTDNIASSGVVAPRPGPNRGHGARPRGAFALLGLLTLATQSVLLRELFSVLYGSDLAFGFALAAWTVLTAAGALAAMGSPRRPAGVWRWGSVTYAGSGLAVFLAVRTWGAQELIPFHAYLLIPVFLAPLCLLGGALFPWYLRASGVPAAEAYGWEVAGGLGAGIVVAALFHQGALACPLLLGLLLVAAAWAASPGRRARCGRVLALAGVLATALSLWPLSGALERLSLRLRIRDGQILDAVNTPAAALVAVRSAAGVTVVRENGVPWAAEEPTLERAALGAVLWSLPTACRQAVLVHAWRAGLAPVLHAGPPGVSTRFVEADAAAVAFARRHLAVGSDKGAVTPFDAQALRLANGGWDLAAVLSPSPGGLLLNRPLTREFARQVRAALAPGGVFVIALPMAPGFTHPGQDAWIGTVRRALHDTFPATCELRTQLGWALLVGADEPLDRVAIAARLHRRFATAEPGVVAEALAVIHGQRELSLELLAGAPPKAAPAALEPANCVGSPRAYFRFLQFRGHLVEAAPGWWRWLFRERSVGWSAGLVGLLWIATLAHRRTRRFQDVFWAAWGATATLIFAVYLCQSLSGQAFWATALLSAAALLGILGGTRVQAGGARGLVAAGLAGVPAALFPLYPLLARVGGTALLACLLSVVCLTGAVLGYAFARGSRAASASAQGGTLFALDLLGAGAGLFLGGVLLPWWSGFQWAAGLGALAASAGLAVAAMRAGA